MTDATETDDESLVGDIAHIIAESPDGARGDSLLTLPERNKAANLLLLCKNHHKEVDDQPGKYTVESLHQLKREHKAWVTGSLGTFDPAIQRDREICASYVSAWESQCNLESWEHWTEGLLASDQPSIQSSVFDALSGHRQWIFKRVWPGSFADLEDAMENFRYVLQDLQELFRLHSEQRGELLWTEKFYKSADWDADRYDHRLAQYHFHVDLIQDLTLELTRAANYVCDVVRRRLDPGYRMEAGLVTVVRGLDSFFRIARLRPQYRVDEAKRRPYKGLLSFEIVRSGRDIHIGEGASPS